MRIILIPLLSLLICAPAFAGYRTTYNPDTGVKDFIGVNSSSDIAVPCPSGQVLLSSGGGVWACGAAGTGSGMSIGDAVTSGTSGSVLFVDGSGNLGQDNPAFTYDATNNTSKHRSDGSHNMEEWGDGSGAAYSYFNSKGSLKINGQPAEYALEIFDSTGATSLLRVTNGTGDFNTSGEISTSSGIRTIAYGAYMGVFAGQRFVFNSNGIVAYGGNTTDVVLAVRGVASQSGNLQEWQNSSLATLASIDSAGNFSSTNITGTNTGDQTNITGNAGTATIAANLGADGVDALTEIAQSIKTASNDTSKLVVGTAGATDDCAKWDADGNLVTAGAACGTASGAPTDAQYIVMTANGGLSAERVFTSGDGVKVAQEPGIARVSWDSSYVTGGDIACSGPLCNVQANSVALTTDTTGNYVQSLATTSPLTGGTGGSEGAALTIAIPAANASTNGYMPSVSMVSIDQLVVKSHDAVTVAGNNYITLSGQQITANDVPLGSQTSGFYAAGDAEAGNALTGDSATSFFVAGTLEVLRGGTALSSISNDALLVGNNAGTGFDQPPLPNCVDSAGNHLNYTASNGSFSCGTSSGSGSSGWTDNGTLVRQTTSTDNVLVGGNEIDFGAQFQIDGKSDKIQALVRGNGTQTTKIFSVQNSASADRFTVSNDGSIVAASTGTFGGTDQSSLTEGLLVNSGAGTDEDDDFQVKTSGGVIALEVDAGDGTVTSALTGSIGWSIQSAANQACNTTCTSACVFGEDSGTVGVLNSSIVGCSDASADKCVCAGAS